MQDKAKTQPKAFRITEDTSNKFKEITQALGANQEQALAKLIEVYELEMGRTSIPEARENIDTFEGYIRAAANMYMQALESNQNMRALVRTEYESQLKTKDKLIEELYVRVDEAEGFSKSASEREKEYANSINELKSELSAKEKELKKVKDENIANILAIEANYTSLESSYAKLLASEEDTRAVLSTYMKENEKLKSENDSLREKNRELDVKVFSQGRECVELEQKLEQAQRELRDERASRADEFGQYRKNIELEHRLALTELENTLETQHKAEMDELRKELDKYRDLYYQNNK